MDKVYKAFFHCNDYLHWIHRPDYDNDNIYDLPQMFKRTAHIHVVTTTNEGSIGPSGFQGGAASTSPSTLTERAVGSLSTDQPGNA